MKIAPLLICTAVAATLVGCGGQSRDDKIKQVVASFEEGAGVDYPDTETNCMGGRLVDKLKESDLRLDDPAKLSPEGRAEIVATLDACFSRESVAKGLKRSLEGQLPAAIDVDCVATAVAEKVTLGQLFKASDPKGSLDKAAQDAITNAVTKCVKK